MATKKTKKVGPKVTIDENLLHATVNSLHVKIVTLTHRIAVLESNMQELTSNVNNSQEFTLRKLEQVKKTLDDACNTVKEKLTEDAACSDVN